MDRRVKERLIGASILLTLIVLIVPELLSGPKPIHASRAASAEPIRNVTVDLGNRSAAAQSDATPPGPAEPASGNENATGNSDGSAGTAAISSLQAPERGVAAGDPSGAPRSNQAPGIRAHGGLPAAPAPVAAASSAPEAAHRGWVVQLGSFASRPNAERLEQHLKNKGFVAYVASGGSGRAQRYRVRIGPTNDLTSAQKILARLKKEGRSASIVML